MTHGEFKAFLLMAQMVVEKCQTIEEAREAFERLNKIINEDSSEDNKGDK